MLFCIFNKQELIVIKGHAKADVQAEETIETEIEIETLEETDQTETVVTFVFLFPIPFLINFFSLGDERGHWARDCRKK